MTGNPLLTAFDRLGESVSLAYHWRRSVGQSIITNNKFNECKYSLESTGHHISQWQPKHFLII